jgi:integrase
VLDAVKEHRRSVAASLLAAGRPWDEDAPICGEIKPDRLTHGLRQLFERRKLPPIHMHLLRHAVATDMLRRGVNPRALQQWLGHAHVSTTLGMYSHVNEDDVKAASQALAASWEKATAQRLGAPRHQTDTKRPAVVDIGARRLGKTPAQTRKSPEDAG